MIDTDKYEGHTEGPWKWLKDSILLKGRAYATNRNAYVDSFIIGGRHLDGEWPIDDEANAQLIADAPLLLAEVKRLRVGIRGILSDYDITELIRDVPEDEWNFEQQALVRMKELIE
jgi:hypothetical protein|tara:strand:- start:1203 stop:1550 length:348 start_codon:yes stop_codon:yes gene_type:complete